MPRSIFGFLLIFFLTGPLRSYSQAEPADLSIETGDHEIIFKNGKKVSGDILAFDKNRIQFRPYDGTSFYVPPKLVGSTRKLDPSEATLEKAAALANAGKYADAIKQLKSGPHGKASAEI